MGESSRRPAELAREVAEWLAEGVGLILAGVLAGTLLALVVGSTGASYTARVKILFPELPGEIRASLPPPARDFLSTAVKDELMRRLRAGGAPVPDDLSSKLLVLQRSEDAAELVANGPSRGGAIGLVSPWVDSFFAVRTRVVRRALHRLRSNALARLRRARAPAARQEERRRIAEIDVLAVRSPPDAELARGPTLGGYRDLVPWPAPVGGLLLGAAAAVWRGVRRRRLRTLASLRSFGLTVLGRVPRDDTDRLEPAATELIASKLTLRTGRRPRTLLVTTLDDSTDDAGQLASALAEGSHREVRTQRWDEAAAGVESADAWVVAITLGALDRDAALARLARLRGDARDPDGLVALDPRERVLVEQREPARAATA